jgi:hypothetical protein
MKADFIRCACTRINDPWRHFCGGCGRKLGPSCGCGFVNAKSDHFCGGCGTSVSQAPRAVKRTDEPTTMPIEIIELVS